MALSRLSAESRRSLFSFVLSSVISEDLTLRSLCIRDFSSMTRSSWELNDLVFSLSCL